ncbi:MAG: riboflavin synthase [Candidatus Omnitrophota bacterium]
MFTGIIEETGQVKAMRKRGAITRLEILSDKVAEGTKVGDSICVNGACLTVVGVRALVLSFDVIGETLGATTLKSLAYGERLNLERALKAGDRMGGHFVSGHVDCVAAIRSRKISRGNLEFQIGVSPKFLRYIVRKGSVAVDGISLTIADKKSGGFSVCIIPHTAKATTLWKKQSGDKVNIEFDMLLKGALST